MAIVAIYTFVPSSTGVFESREPIAADRIGTGSDQRTYPVAKMAFGEPGAVTHVSSTNPIPIIGSLTDAQLRASAIAVSGPLTDSQLRASSVPVSGPFLTNAELRATSIPVSGTFLTDSQIRATALAVSGPATNAEIRATPIAVSGPLTDAQLRSTAINVSGPLTDTQLRASPISITGPLTDAQLRASAIAVSGPLTDAQLRTTPVPIAGPIGGYTKVATGSIVRPADSNAYVDGDEVSNSTSSPTILAISGCSRVNGGSGVITNVSLIASDCPTTAPTFEIWLFDSTSTPNNDNSSFAPLDAVVSTCIGVVNFPSSFKGDSSSGGNRVFLSGPISLPFVCENASTSLYVRLVVRSAYSPISGLTYTVRLGIVQD